jgi:hypothetical protein
MVTPSARSRCAIWVDCQGSKPMLTTRNRWHSSRMSLSMVSQSVSLPGGDGQVPRRGPAGVAGVPCLQHRRLIEVAAGKGRVARLAGLRIAAGRDQGQRCQIGSAGQVEPEMAFLPLERLQRQCGVGPLPRVRLGLRKPRISQAVSRHCSATIRRQSKC